jgi:hypothetical protein
VPAVEGLCRWSCRAAVEKSDWNVFIQPAARAQRRGRAAQVTRYAHGFDFLTVRGAGHMVPQMKPAAALEMIGRWLQPWAFESFRRRFVALYFNRGSPCKIYQAPSEWL